MTDNTQQGLTAADVTAIGATIAGVAAVILVATLPHHSIGFGLAAAVAAVILALTAARAARNEHRAVPWSARIGSMVGVAAIAMIVVWEIARAQ